MKKPFHSDSIRLKREFDGGEDLIRTNVVKRFSKQSQCGFMKFENTSGNPHNIKLYQSHGTHGHDISLLAYPLSLTITHK